MSNQANRIARRRTVPGRDHAVLRLHGVLSEIPLVETNRVEFQQSTFVFRIVGLFPKIQVLSDSNGKKYEPALFTNATSNNVRGTQEEPDDLAKIEKK
jgi:hypothetical protein